jgi:hypothetical protein
MLAAVHFSRIATSTQACQAFINDSLKSRLRRLKIAQLLPDSGRLREAATTGGQAQSMEIPPR